MCPHEIEATDMFVSPIIPVIPVIPAQQVENQRPILMCPHEIEAIDMFVSPIIPVIPVIPAQAGIQLNIRRLRHIIHQPVTRCRPSSGQTAPRSCRCACLFPAPIAKLPA